MQRRAPPPPRAYAPRTPESGEALPTQSHQTALVNWKVVLGTVPVGHSVVAIPPNRSGQLEGRSSRSPCVNTMIQVAIPPNRSGQLEAPRIRMSHQMMTADVAIPPNRSGQLEEMERIRQEFLLYQRVAIPPNRSGQLEADFHFHDLRGIWAVSQSHKTALVNWKHTVPQLRDELHRKSQSHQTALVNWKPIIYIPYSDARYPSQSHQTALVNWKTVLEAKLRMDIKKSQSHQTALVNWKNPWKREELALFPLGRNPTKPLWSIGRAAFATPSNVAT